MKLRNKIFAGFAATVLALSMMAGTALAADKLPAEFDSAAGGGVLDGQTDGQDVWIKIIGGGDVIYGTPDIANATRSVDITITGKCSFDAEFVYNSSNGWSPAPVEYGLSVDGVKVLTYEMNGEGTNWCEAIINLRNKSEGELTVAKMDFKDEAGNILLTVGEFKAETTAAPAEEAAAPAEEAAPAKAETKKEAAPAKETKKSAPKTGVASTAFIFGLGALSCGTGALVLKKKEK